MAMKIQVGPYKLSIIAEDTYGFATSKEAAASSFLNEICVALLDARKVVLNDHSYTPAFAEMISEKYQAWADNIYDELKKRGFYAQQLEDWGENDRKG